MCSRNDAHRASSNFKLLFSNSQFIRNFLFQGFQIQFQNVILGLIDDSESEETIETVKANRMVASIVGSSDGDLNAGILQTNLKEQWETKHKQWTASNNSVLNECPSENSIFS